MNKTSEEAPLPRSGEKYDRILEAAIEVVAEKGFQHARIADIASRAGVADGTIYLYFDNKNHILRAAIDSAFEQFSSRVRTALAETDDPIAQLRTIARLHIETLVARRNLAIIVQTQVRQSAKFLEQFSHHSFVDYINLVREVVRAGQREGYIRRDISDRVTALCLFGALDEMISSWLLTGKPIDPEVTATQVLDILWNGIRQPSNHA